MVRTMRALCTRSPKLHEQRKEVINQQHELPQDIIEEAKLKILAEIALVDSQIYNVECVVQVTDQPVYRDRRFHHPLPIGTLAGIAWPGSPHHDIRSVAHRLH